MFTVFKFQIIAIVVWLFIYVLHVRKDTKVKRDDEIIYVYELWSLN